MITLGRKYESRMTVTEEVTARTVGSGDMDVLATPMMIALMENAAMNAVAADLAQGESTVGGHISVSHVRPTPIGAEIRAMATVTKIEGRKIQFRVEAYEGDKLIGEGEHLRFIVNREKFLLKIN